MIATKQSSFWLLGIASGAIAIHLTLLLRADDYNLLVKGILLWVAAASLVWSKRYNLNLNSGLLPSFLGSLLLAIVLLKSSSVSGSDPFLQVSPLLSCLAVALLASGFRGLKQYWRELLILGILIPPPAILDLLGDISPITAKFSTLILWALGFAVSRNGVIITLPTGAVEVYSGCSGIQSIFDILGLSAVFLLVFPTQGWKKFLVPMVGILVAFIVNGFRVALMAVLVASSNRSSFDYWHHGDGAFIFSMIAVLGLGLFCFFILDQENVDNYDAEELGK